MKKLKFAEPLPKLVLTGRKDTTWRVGDEKNITCGDRLSLCYSDGLNKENEFAKAVVLWTKETTFENLTNEDYEGHEKFNSENEMYNTYSKYYKMKITPQTKVKVVKFKLVNNL